VESPFPVSHEPPPPPPPARSVNLENKSVRRILEAALRCWSRNGYHGASLKEIAAEAGVAKSLLHYHFASKEHLLVELQAHHNRQVAEAVRERLATRPPSIEHALAALEELWGALLATRNQLPFAIEVWRASLSNPAVRERLNAFHAEMQTMMHEGIVSALGPLADHMTIPPERLAPLIQVALEGFWLHLWLTRDDARLKAVYQDFKTLIMCTLHPQAAAVGAVRSCTAVVSES
jgi:AcrR family transcriptional regulator